MKDSRFTTVFTDAAHLIDGMDIDDIGDLETMLMFLLTRPVTVTLDEEDGDAGSVQVTVWGETVGYGSITEFPTTVVELALDGARLAVEGGPYDGRASTVQAGADVLRMSDDDLITALRRALGMVRVFTAHEDD